MIDLLIFASVTTAQPCPHKLVDGKRICLTKTEVDEMEVKATVDANRRAAEKAREDAKAARHARIKSGCPGATGLLKDLCEEISGQ